MDENNLWSNQNLIKIIKEDGVAVMPTDTLYGIVGKALNPHVVGRIYEARKRNPEKPCIILIGDLGELEKFSISLSEKQKETIQQYQTTPTSFVLDCRDAKLSYLHRGTHSLAFRLPAQEDLKNLLKETGPIIAPSANLEGFPPAQNILDAKKYFSDSVDLYIDWGEIKSKASRVIRLNKDGPVEILRL